MENSLALRDCVVVVLVYGIMMVFLYRIEFYWH